MFVEQRKRAEKALTSVVATCYLLGVSTRRMNKFVQSLGITGISKSQVSVMAKDLDAHVEAFRRRRLDQGPYTFVAADALVLKVREACPMTSRWAGAARRLSRSRAAATAFEGGAPACGRCDSHSVWLLHGCTVTSWALVLKIVKGSSVAGRLGAPIPLPGVRPLS